MLPAVASGISIKIFVDTDPTVHVALPITKTAITTLPVAVAIDTGI